MGLILAVGLAMSAALLAQAFLVGVILVRLYQGRPLAEVSGLPGVGDHEIPQCEGLAIM